MTAAAAVSAALATDVGRVREHNEDAGIVTPSLFAVADGMGGHAAGEVASRIVVDTLRPLGDKTGFRLRDLARGIADANSAILDSAASHPEQTGMATTLAGLAWVDVDGDSRWAVFNVGDSRIYRYADGGLRQVSEDHSEVAELVALGIISPEDALRHPARNIVTRCLGREPLDPVDTWILAPEAGERFLLCTDGLTNELSDSDIAAVLRRGDEPQVIADALVTAAVESGGRDNVTVVVVLGKDRPEK
jgi:PPM family protein phosphatase